MSTLCLWGQTEGVDDQLDKRSQESTAAEKREANKTGFQKL